MNEWKRLKDRWVVFLCSADTWLGFIIGIQTGLNPWHGDDVTCL